MGGKVVHARGGVRANYPLLNSTLTQQTDLFGVITAMLDFYPFETFYIADLDAISGHHKHHAVYRQLSQQFSHTTFWIDAGTANPQQIQIFEGLDTILPVVGSETLVQSSSLAALTDRPYVLSLDFQHGKLLGDALLFKATKNWPNQVIVMDLDAVGKEQGPGIKRLKAIQALQPNIKLIASGGVRNKHDLLTLQAMQIDSVLVASALHNSAITLADLAFFRQ